MMSLQAMSDQELRERYDILQKTDNHKNELVQVNLLANRVERLLILKKH